MSHFSFILFVLIRGKPWLYTVRAIYKSFFAAEGGREMGESEGTSRSVKGLPPLAYLSPRQGSLLCDDF
jgi:hypothetical protein